MTINRFSNFSLKSKAKLMTSQPTTHKPSILLFPDRFSELWHLNVNAYCFVQMPNLFSQITQMHSFWFPSTAACK